MRFLRKSRVGLLEQVPLFNGCSRKDLEFVAGLASEVSFEDGVALLREGVKGHEFLLVVDGQADVSLDGKNVASIRAGDYVGEISLLGQTRRTATVVAKGPVRALALDEEAFEKMLRRVPGIRTRVSKGAFDRLVGGGSDQSSD